MREKLVEIIISQGYPEEETAPIVTLEDFFKGNEDESSIGCHLLEHPGLDTFYHVLLNIREREDVQDVFVEIMELEDDEDSWPFSERIYILTNAELEEVEEWVQPLEPSELDEGYAFGVPPSAPILNEGFKVYSVWWD